MSASTCGRELAERLLGCCLNGEAWSEPELQQLAGLALDLNREVSAEASRNLFSVLVEGLADRFEPSLCDAYADLFSRVPPRVFPELEASDLRARYQRVRQVRAYSAIAPVHDVYVLSRVTIGADIAVTSVLLDAACRRFPEARIRFVGSPKNAELWAGDPRIGFAKLDYPRGDTLRGRLSAFRRLRELVSSESALVIDPDSRLTQLGLLPLNSEERYLFFESRAYGSQTSSPLSTLAATWVRETLGIEAVRPFLALPPSAVALDLPRPLITVSFGVGGNPSKEMSEDFERKLMAALDQRAGTVIVDQGFGLEETNRTLRAVAGCSHRVQTFSGSFAEFANCIRQSDLYVGYDSAGQHAAAACRIPSLVIFKGFASSRMFSRWSPVNQAPQEIIRIDRQSETQVFEASEAALERLLAVR